MSSNYVSKTLPTIAKRRSKFDLNYNHKTTMNVGDLIPFFTQEIYPGDTFKAEANILSRVASSWVKAPMDNLVLDTYYFFVPNRLVFDKWQELMGENKTNAWAQPEDIEIPQLKFKKKDAPTTNSGNLTGSLSDYFGIPLAKDTEALPEISSLYHRAYALIYNEWFRDQNNQDPVNIKTGGDVEYNNNEAFGPTNYTGKPAQINKLHDYFTSALRAPQKGNPVQIGIGNEAPIITGADIPHVGGRPPLKFRNSATGSIEAKTFGALINGTETGNPGAFGINNSSGEVPNGNTTVAPANLWTDLSQASAININDLRFAFQLQKLLERDARGGTRYTEIILNHFGVTSPDARLQRPEFLGGNRNPVQIQQVVQTSNTEGSSPQGNVSGYTLSGANSGFRKSFTEHGMVIGVMAIRQKHTYQQGINKTFFRKKRVDFYDPVFANIGEQPILSKEIYAVDNDTENVFGYNEAWADLRHKPDIVSGQFRSESGSGFDIWHFADNYRNAPVIGDEFVKETPTYVDRALSVTSAVSHQFIVDIFVKNEAIRVLPTYSVPGMIDHN